MIGLVEEEETLSAEEGSAGPGAGGVGSARVDGFVLDLPPIIPSFVGFLAGGVATVDVKPATGEWSCSTGFEDSGICNDVGAGAGGGEG